MLSALILGQLDFPGAPGDKEMAQAMASTITDVLVVEQAGPDSPGVEVHDGFFFRSTIGPGYGYRRSPGPKGDVSVNVGGMGAAFSFGGSLTRSLVLFGAFSMEFSMGGTAAGGEVAGAANPNSTLMSQGLTVGVSYYFVPSNVYLELAAGAGFYAISVGGTEECGVFSEECTGENETYHDASDNNVAAVLLSIGAGKEWWVSADWGLGLALRVTVPIPVQDGTLQLKQSAGFGLSAAFSATFN